MREFLVRAHLELTRDWEQESERRELRCPSRLPIDIGPFLLDQSPNFRIYLAESGWLNYDLVEHLSQDSCYPTSLLYIESKIQVPDNGRPLRQADELFELLECSFRLFQPGGISIRRHDRQWLVDGHNLEETFFLGLRLPKPETATLYERPPYPLDDDILDGFIEFFNRHWPVLRGNPPSFLSTGTMRFNSSYERRDLADRLVDLVVALEALFGDGESGSISYKVATRCAYWLYPQGEERLATFESLRKLYGMRNSVIHGGSNASPTEGQVDQLEAMVRMSLVRFLDYRAETATTPHGKDLDTMILTGKL